MKNSSISNLVGILFLVATMMLFGACCRGVKCHDDIFVLEEVKKLFPYQPGDKFSYVSETDDTLAFVCSKREFIYSDGFEFDDVEKECCDTYTIENLSISFENTNGDSIIIATSDYFQSGNLFSKIEISNSVVYGNWQDQFSRYPTSSKLDTIQLAGRTFYSIYPSENGKIYLQPDSLGIIGFVIDGKEWRKL